MAFWHVWLQQSQFQTRDSKKSQTGIMYIRCDYVSKKHPLSFLQDLSHGHNLRYSIFVHQHKFLSLPFLFYPLAKLVCSQWVGTPSAVLGPISTWPNKDSTRCTEQPNPMTAAKCKKACTMHTHCHIILYEFLADRRRIRFV